MRDHCSIDLCFSAKTLVAIGRAHTMLALYGNILSMGNMRTSTEVEMHFLLCNSMNQDEYISC
jgi:hypothetical protein